MKKDCNPSPSEIQEIATIHKMEYLAYSFFVTSIVTLKFFFKQEGYKAHIEPKITINDKEKKPDLLVFDENNGTGVAIDHKFFRVKKRCFDLAEEIMKINEYIGRSIYRIRNNTINVNIINAVLITPFKISWENISHCARELSTIPYIAYSLDSRELKIVQENLSSIKFPMILRKRKRIPIPDVARRIHFLSQEPPVSYLIRKLYDFVLSLSYYDPLSGYHEIPVGVLKGELIRSLPRWETTGGYSANQISSKTISDFVKWIRIIGIGEIKGGAIIIKRPRGKIYSEDIFEKLAIYDICKEKERQTRKTLLDWIEQ